MNTNKGIVIISVIPENRKQLLRLQKNYENFFFEYPLNPANDWNWLNQDTVNERTVLTLRDPQEAPKEQQYSPVSLSEKLKLYRKWQSQYNCLVDLELSNWKKAKEGNLLDKDRLILSWHSVDEYNNEVTADKLKQIDESGSRWGKLALRLDKWSDLLDLEKQIQRTKTDILLAFTDSSGISKRCLFRHLGGAGTYAGLADCKTANGQPDPELAALIRLQVLTGQEAVFGIIGGSQVIDSLGLKYYNRLFRDLHLKAVYLPFIVNDLKDFLNWKDKSVLSDKCKGFSITMPWKEELSAYTGQKGEVVNYYDSRTRTENTDIIAFKNILQKLDLRKESRILLAGSGSTAKVILSVIKESHLRAEISARNFPRAISLCKEFNCRYIIPENTKERSYDLLINATSLGMDHENLLDMILCRKFRNVLDLPYNDTETPLGVYCRHHGIRYVSGEDFWKLQSAKQEQYFLKSLME